MIAMLWHFPRVAGHRIIQMQSIWLLTVNNSVHRGWILAFERTNSVASRDAIPLAFIANYCLFGDR